MKIAMLAALTGAAALTASAVLAQPHADFGPAANGHRVRLLNPVFTVKLPENASTGYHWQLQPNLSHNVVVLKEQTSTRPHPPGMVGVGGARSFTLRANAMNGDITLWYVPPGRRGGAGQIFHLAFVSDHHGGAHRLM